MYLDGDFGQSQVIPDKRAFLLAALYSEMEGE